MTYLDPTASLAIAEIAFFSLALIFGLFVVSRHGFSRHAGWIFIVILCILRLIGSSATVYIQTHPLPPSKDLLEVATITSIIGTAPLLMALAGLLGRINDDLKPSNTHIGQIVFRLIHLGAVLALILSIIGGVFRSNSDASKVSTGTSLSKAASIIFLAVFLGDAAIAAVMFRRKQYIFGKEWYLVIAALVALPFIMVRVIYTILVSFSTSPTSDFYYADVDVYASAFMQFLMEGIVVIIFVAVGLLTPKQEKAPVRSEVKPLEA